MLFWDGRPEIQKGMFIKGINNKASINTIGRQACFVIHNVNAALQY